jgi:hypothetical protein
LSSSPGPGQEKLDRSELMNSEASSNSSTSSFSSSLSRHYYLHGEGLERLRSQLPRSESKRQDPILQSVDTRSSRIRSRKPFDTFRHPLAQVTTKKNVIVEFDEPNDPYRPTNWRFKKAVTTLLYRLMTIGSSWASSVISSAITQISEEFHVKSVVATAVSRYSSLALGLGCCYSLDSVLYSRRLLVCNSNI